MKIFKFILNSVKEAMSKFVVSFYGSIIIFILASIQIIFDVDEEIYMRIIFAVAFSVLASIMLQLMSLQYNYSKKMDIIQKIFSSALAVPCYFLIKNIFESDYIFLGYFGLILCFIVIALFLMYNCEKQDLIFPQIIKSGFFSVIVASLFFGGIALCLLAFDFLVTELPDFDNWFIITGLLAYIVICFNLFIALLPEKKDNINLPKIFKVLVLYVGLPIYTLLLAVLYAYLVKILITMDMPQGQINIFASLASLFFIFFYLNLGSYENRAVSFFRKFGGWFLLPIIASQAVAIYIRVNAYGLTTARWISILLNITALAFIIISLIKKGKFVKHVITGFAVIILLSSIGPLNVMDIPIYEQSHRLEKVLEANGMFFDGKITPKSDLTKEDMRIISSCYDYLKYTDNPPAYLDNDLAFYSLFGFEQLNSYGEPDPYNMIHLNKYVQYDDIDISEYSRYIKVAAYSNDKFEMTIEDIAYDIADEIMAIKQDDNKEDMIFSLSSDITVYLTTVYYEMDNENNIMYFSAEGFALIR